MVEIIVRIVVGVAGLTLLAAIIIIWVNRNDHK